MASGGGHAGAAGVRVEKEKFEEFKQGINDYYKSLKLKDQERFLSESADLDVRELGDFSLEFLQELASLEPFGEGNLEPVFCLSEVEVVEPRRIGSEMNHLSLMVRGDDNKTMKLLAFSAPEQWFRLMPGEKANILVKIFANEWNGVTSVEGRILDIL